jgi:glucosamine-6-phosphate deaminase
MEVLVGKGHKEMSEIALQIFLDSFKSSKVLGFATGNTPMLFYEMLIAEFRKGSISFSRKITFNLDEYCGIGKWDKRGYRSYMFDNLFSHVDVNEKNVHIPDSSLGAKAALIYRKEIQKYGPIDFQMLGIGVNGHIGFNEPGSSKDSLTRIVRLSSETIKRNGNVSDKAITMGISEILKSKRIMLMASGADKAEAVAAAIDGKVGNAVPASYLQMHKDAIFVLDEKAAKRLK